MKKNYFNKIKAFCHLLSYFENCNEWKKNTTKLFPMTASLPPSGLTILHICPPGMESPGNG